MILPKRKTSVPPGVVRIFVLTCFVGSSSIRTAKFPFNFSSSINDFQLAAHSLFAPSAEPVALSCRLFKMVASASKEDVDFSIKPEAVTPSIPTSEWPLLLKNYDKREHLDGLSLYYVYPSS